MQIRMVQVLACYVVLELPHFNLRIVCGAGTTTFLVENKRTILSSKEIQIQLTPFSCVRIWISSLL